MEANLGENPLIFVYDLLTALDDYGDTERWALLHFCHKLISINYSAYFLLSIAISSCSLHID